MQLGISMTTPAKHAFSLARSPISVGFYTGGKYIGAEVKTSSGKTQTFLLTLKQDTHHSGGCIFAGSKLCIRKTYFVPWDVRKMFVFADDKTRNFLHIRHHKEPFTDADSHFLKMTFLVSKRIVNVTI